MDTAGEMHLDVRCVHLLLTVKTKATSGTKFMPNKCPTLPIETHNRLIHRASPTSSTATVSTSFTIWWVFTYCSVGRAPDNTASTNK